MKAERARRNPQVCLLYSKPTGSGLVNPPTVLVYGMAAVRDANLQANTDRYVQVCFTKTGDAMTVPPFIMRTMSWYFARIWVEVTPIRILWWDDTNQAPYEWRAPIDLAIPISDPAPQSAASTYPKETSANWRIRADYVLHTLGKAVLTVVDDSGFPVPFRVQNIEKHPDGFSFEMPAYAPAPARGKACLTFHEHPEIFTAQENMVFMGEIADDGTTFIVDRCPGDWSIPSGRLPAMWSMLNSCRKLLPRIKEEAARRNQPVPVVNLPKK